MTRTPRFSGDQAVGPQLQKSRRGGIKSVSAFHPRVYNESGTKLGDFDLGSEDEGHVELDFRRFR
ncbi:hypothetical protein [Streptomyces mirabilis]|uniref:hypothetical protein n=1 Tax=Streptomyces mirabilis TaxID=68239 RepID=UPI003665EF57